MSVVGTNGRFTPLQAGQFSNAGPLGGAAGMPNQVSPPGLFPGDALPEGVEDIDDKKFKTTKYDPTYAASIHAHKRDLETKYIIARRFLGATSHQPDINEHMRVTLLDWLVVLAEQIRLGPSTYALTIHLIDQALSKITVKRSQFQLLGCSCLLIAAKLEELQPPLVNDLVLRSDYCFDVDELISYEQHLMTVFELQPALPTRYYFAQRYASAGKCTPREISMAIFLTELSLYKVEFSLLPMSHVAAAAVHLALQILRPLSEDAPSTHLSRLVRADGEEVRREQEQRGAGGALSVGKDIGRAGNSKGDDDDDDDDVGQNSSDSDSGRDSSNSDGNGGGAAARKREIWTESLEYYSQYREWELVDTILKLREAHFYMEETDQTRGIMGRYSRERFFSVSLSGSLRIQDVRFDSEEAWKEFWAHPASQLYPAGGVAAAEQGQGQGLEMESSRVAIDQSLSTNDLATHQHQQSAEQQQQQQYQQQQHQQQHQQRQQRQQQQQDEQYHQQQQQHERQQALLRHEQLLVQQQLSQQQREQKQRHKQQQFQQQMAMAEEKPGLSRAGSTVPPLPPQRTATAKGGKAAAGATRGRNANLIGEAAPGASKRAQVKLGASRPAPLRPKAAVPIGSATSSGGGGGSSSSSSGSIRPSGTSAFSAPAVGGSATLNAVRGAGAGGARGEKARQSGGTSRSASTVTTTEEDSEEGTATAAAYQAGKGRGAGIGSRVRKQEGAGMVTEANHLGPDAKRSRKQEAPSMQKGHANANTNASGNSSRSGSARSNAGSDGRGSVQMRISDFAAIKPPK